MKRTLALTAAAFSLLSGPVLAQGTIDTIAGLDNPAPERWRDWYDSIVAERDAAREQAGIDLSLYSDPATAWNDANYRQYMLFMFDPEFYRDGSYRTADLIARLRQRFGSVHSVLLWHAYPQLGFDGRNQFDFYEEMPGGLAGLRREVVEVFHAAGIRVFLDFNPWDEIPNGAEAAAYSRLARAVAALDADGVMLDTLDSVPPALRAAVLAAKPGVVFSPERRPGDAQLELSRQSWAQWYDLGGWGDPSIYRLKWLAPGHQQLAIRRWDRDRAWDIVYSFFNASGLLLWENIYGSWNPYKPGDRALIAETASVLDSYRDVLAEGEWTPLLPTGSSGLDANRWTLGSRSVTLFRNRTASAQTYPIPTAPAGLGYFAFWKAPAPQGFVGVPAYGTQALVLDEPSAALAAIQRFGSASRAAAQAVPVAQGEAPFETVTPEPRQIVADAHGSLLQAPPVAIPSPGYVALPGGSFTMTVTHPKREEGCYPWGGATTAAWGSPFTEVVTHRMSETVRPFAMKLTAVTNGEFLGFVNRSGYRPTDSSRFLAQIPRDASGSLPVTIPPALARLPVTYVSLADARAYARWADARLPTEAEWQWAAEGAGDGRAWPWGNDDTRAADPSTVNLTGALAPADAYPAGASRHGILGLSGNAWELTESEWADGHTRYVMLRGGVYLPPGGSEWMIPRGPRPNGFHAKYLLMSDGVDRSEAIGFRTVQDLR